MAGISHHCLRGGALVPAAGVVPEDASDYLWSAALAEVGCNQVVCRACGGAVTQAAQADGGRRYACGCTSKVVYARRHLDGEPADVMDGPPPEGWTCGGHPARALPCELDGLAVEAHPDWARWLARSVAGELDGRGPGWLGGRPHAWIERLAATVLEAEREDLAATLEAALGGSDPGPRVLALDLAERLGLARVGAHLVAMAAASTFPWGDDAASRAAVGLLRRMAQASDDPEITLALRDALTRAPGASGFVYRLAKVDAAWLAEHAADLVAAQPALASKLLGALADDAPAHLPRALEGLIARGIGPRAQLERAIRRGLPPDQHEAWLARLAPPEGMTP